ncbi:hypothetical protein C9426_14860 [Serratia sp. S1B]|nr:hypothetical protein C9426_14860 [Serratia sp. S1B]
MDACDICVCFSSRAFCTFRQVDYKTILMFSEPLCVCLFAIDNLVAVENFDHFSALIWIYFVVSTMVLQ